MKRFVTFTVPCVNAIIANHLEVLFWNVLNKPLDEFESGNPFGDQNIIFMAGVMEGDKVTVIVIDAGSGDDRSAKIPADVFGDDAWMTFVWFGIDIEAFFATIVDEGLGLLERVTKNSMHFLEKSGAERIPKQFIIEMGDGTPRDVGTCTTFGNKTMNMRIPVKRSAKGV